MKKIQAALAATLMAAQMAAAQHPPSHGDPFAGRPYAPPVTPGFPSFPQPDIVAPQLGVTSGVKSAPGIEERPTVTPHDTTAPMPRYLMGGGREIPSARTTTAPPSLLLAMVADRIRHADNAKPPSKLAGVDVALSKGGFLVTKRYEDYSRTLADGRPAYLWEVTAFVSADEVRVKIPDGGQPPVGTPPPPKPVAPDPPVRPPQGTPENVLKDVLKYGEPVRVEPVTIHPRDMFESNDPQALARRLREVSDSFRGTVIEDRFSDETVAMMEEVMAEAGRAGLNAGLTAASFVPVAGTVIMAGTTFSEQYKKTRDTLVTAGIDPAEAHRQAILQAAAVTGVAVGVDIATGAIADKLKKFIRSPIVDSALHDKQWREESAKRLGQAVDAGSDLLLTAGGTVLKGGLDAGGSGVTQPPAFGGDRNGLYFLVR